MKVTTKSKLGLLVLITLYAGSAMAAGAMPWEGPICDMARSLSGPTATALAVIAIVFCGLTLAFGEMGGIFKTAMGLIIGICMAVLAIKWLPAMTGVNFTCPGGSGGISSLNTMVHLYV